MPSSRRTDAWALALTGAAALAAWLALTGAQPRSLVVGVPTIVAALLAVRASGGAALWPRLLAVPGFALWLLVAMLRSAWDVARRMLASEHGFTPGMVRYELRLRGPGARAAYMNAITLTPGTLSAALDGDRLWVHALDSPDIEALTDLEGRIARLYGERLAERGGAA